MIRQKRQAKRISDGQWVEIDVLVPENEADEREIERLDERGLVSLGDTFAEQLEHAQVREQRQKRPAS